MSDSNFTPDDNNSAQIYSQLIDNPNCQDLRIREIHILARAIAIQENTSRPIEPIFENAELEQPYSVIITSLTAAP